MIHGNAPDTHARSTPVVTAHAGGFETLTRLGVRYQTDEQYTSARPSGGQ